MTGEIAIAGRTIGPDHPPYVVAELSGNHNGDINRALSLIEAAKAAGADAVKIQTYTPDTITLDHDGPGFTIESGPWKGRRLHDLYREAHTPWAWHQRLFDKARELGITLFSAPFDSTAVDLLESLDAPAYKIASFEIVDLPLIARVARTGKPLIVSTGIADVAEIRDAVDTVTSAGGAQLILLHCVSGYPTPPEEANLRTITHMRETFGVPVGLSDHTLGVGTAIAAVALGACLVEKHVTLARKDGGPDAAFSLEPSELSALVEGCRTAWSALGRVSYEPEASERENAVFRRSLYVVTDMAPNDVFTEHNVRSIRPGYGLPPKLLPQILGRRARTAIRRGTPLSLDLITGSTTIR